MKILVIHTAFIGDIILSTPMIKNLKKKYQDCSITYFTTPAGAAVLKGNPNIDNIIIFDKKGKQRGILGMLKAAKNISKEKYDLAVVPHRYLRSALIPFLAGIKERVGYSNSEGRVFFTKLVKYQKELHEVERLNMFTDTAERDECKIELFPSKKEIENIDKLWSEKGLTNSKIVVIAPGSKWFTKMWPLEYFNRLMEMLIKTGIKVVVVGGKEEEKFEIYKDNNVINLIGKTTLLEVYEIVRRSNAIVTNDSSPIHIASATDTFISAIFGATVKELGFYPWSKNSVIIENNAIDCRPCGLHGGNKCPKGHFKCMREIYPERVYEFVINHVYEEE